MAQPILLKRSAVQGNIPTTANLALGELAMNTYDGKLFMRKDNGSPSILDLTSAGTISNVPAGSIVSTTVQAAINELDTGKISKTAASYIQSTGSNSPWGVTNGVNTGAFNAIMGTDSSATWLLSGTSNGVFKSGIQSLDSDGSLRFYSGSNFFQFSGNTLSATNFIGNGASITNVNASSLNGVTALTTIAANTIPIRDGSGKISANAFSGVNSINNTVTYNLGTPAVEEMALIHGEMNNKFRFISPTIQEESTDGTTWTTSTRVSANNLADMMIGEGQSAALQAIIPANSTNSWRITWDINALNSYVFLNKFYSYISTNSNTITIKIEEQDASDSSWNLVTSGSVNGWPIHVYIPHTTIAFQPSASTSDKSKAVRVTFNSTNTSINANGVQLGAIEWFGGYPIGRRNVEYYDRNKYVYFPAGISGTQHISTVGTGTPPLVVASTTKVTNLNADLLDGLDSTAFQPTLISGTNIRTINGNSLLGSTDLAISGTVSVTDDTTTNATYYPVLGTSASGSLNAKVSSTKLTYNPSTGALNATSFNNITDLSSTIPLVSGTATVGVSTTVARADHVHPAQTNITGNAGTATMLQTPRNINGIPFDGSADITINAIDATARIASSEKGVANGVATLDENALIPSSQLPSYVDDVIEFANFASFPTTGETGKIYVALDTNKTYRWSGSIYIYITSGAVDSVAGKTGVVTLVKDDVGLNFVDNTSDLSKPISTAVQSALDLKAPLNSPSLVTPDIGVATGTSFNGITGLSSTTPNMDGIANIGSSTTVALADHTHPSDTSKQDTLVSGTNIKTINGNSLLGSGDINISSGTNNVFIQATQPTPATGEQVFWIKPDSGSFGLYIVTGD
jgi:hypothetical protein